jgi:hypothetical protein
MEAHFEGLAIIPDDSFCTTDGANVALHKLRQRGASKSRLSAVLRRWSSDL